MNNIIITVVRYFTTILGYLILIRCILSWIPLGKNFITELIYTLTEPILEPIRNLLNRSPIGGSGMMIDFSPVIAYLLIQLLENVIVSLLR